MTDPNVDRATRLLALLLRLVGGLLLLAWPFVFLPESWMAASHRALGLGEFLASPLVDYLTRSVSVLYGFHGVLYLALASDVVRFLPVIRVLALLDMIAGVLLLGIDLHAGLPLYWVLAEGPPVFFYGGVLWILARLAANAASVKP